MIKKEQFRAGAAQVDITPMLGTRMNGDFITHYATSVHDPLFSKALVMDDGKTRMAIVIVDTCAMQRSFLDPIKIEIEKRLGIKRQHILIASTHTHSGGSLTDLLMSGVDIMYRDRLPALLIESVELAYKNLRPAVIGFGKANAPEHVLCRRYFMKQGYQARNPLNDQLDIVKTNPLGDEEFIDRRASEVDDELAFLIVKGTDDQYISVLANYSLHYVGDFPNGTISADYFGYFANHLSSALDHPKGFVGIMSNGTSGEANIWDFMHPERQPKGPYEKSRLIGHSLAEKVHSSIEAIEWQQSPSLSALYSEVKLQIRKPSPKELADAEAIVASANFENIVPDDEGKKTIYAREQVFLNGYDDFTYIPVQSIRIGDMVIGAVGAELFAETGIAAKKALADQNYFTICLANDYIGYIPPEEEFALGGYETWRCRTSQVTIDSESIVRDTLVRLNEASPT